MTEGQMQDLLDVIDGRNTSVKVIYAAIVTSVEYNQMRATVKFPADDAEFTFLNKCGEKLSVGDSVYVYAPDGDLTTGYISLRFGGFSGEMNRFVYNTTIPTSGWSASAPYTLTISISGILSTDIAHISPVYSTTASTRKSQKEAWGKVTMIDTVSDGITIYCDETKPATSIPIQIEVIR